MNLLGTTILFNLALPFLVLLLAFANYSLLLLLGSSGLLKQPAFDVAVYIHITLEDVTVLFANLAVLVPCPEVTVLSNKQICLRNIL